MSTGGDARWSESIDSLLSCGRVAPQTCDVLIVGSGYGGSFAARELASTAQVWVVERGREYALGEFPEDIGALPGHVRFHRRSKEEFTGNGDALFDVRMYNDVSVLLANGLGGGSLINAGVALRPDEQVLDDGWPSHYRQDAGRAQLFEAMREVEAALQARPFGPARNLDKFHVFSEFGKRAGFGDTELMPVTIADRSQSSPAGLHQDACIQCGNCFTGCNTGAKNTLVSHVIPLAVRDGARFFTGATALRVEPYRDASMLTAQGRPVRWVVHFERTSQFRGKPDDGAGFKLFAHTVILSAGTLGSTELLLRSSDPQRLPLSPALGKRFSTNGDTIAMGWGMRPEVNGVSAPLASDSAPSRNVGPTIVAGVRAKVLVEGEDRPVMLQDGAIPSALAQAVIALGTGLSFAHRYTKEEPAAAYDGQPDMLATPPCIGRHAMLVLGMGRDVDTGEVTLQQADPQKSRKRTDVPGKLDVVFRKRDAKAQPDYPWPELKRPESRDLPYHRAVDELLEQAEEAGAFQGGDFLSNPLWRPFPKDFALIGGEPPHKLITVHPLGGCAMGDDGECSVVDWKGAVFRGGSEAVHEGLHVVDGAMIPGALGVNPFLTISALSVLAAREIRRNLQQRGLPPPLGTQAAWPAVQPRVPALPLQPCAPIRVEFEERLQGDAAQVPGWLEDLLTARNQSRLPLALRKREWIVRVTATIDLHAWMANPSMPHTACLELFHNPFANETTVQDEAVREPPLLYGTGRICLLALDAPRDEDEQDRRKWAAVLTYALRRSTKDFQSLTGGGGGIRKWKSAFQAYFRAGCHHALRRLLSYRFDLESPASGAKFEATGDKLLAFSARRKNVWDALTELDLTIKPVNGDAPARLALKVDLVDLVRNRRLQVIQAPNTPATIVGLATFASLWLRSIFTTHFWTFRGPGIELMDRLEPELHQGLKPGDALDEAVHPEVCCIDVPRGSAGPGCTHIELTRYDPPQNSNKEHLLMIHGLAHGGAVFTTNTVGSHNMATFFLAKGYTVWVLDHRLSNRLGYAAEPHTMDDLARHDIPAAVAHVRAAAGRAIHVFAHCVGAGAFSMAALKGWLGEGSSWISRAILHAVHPWVVPSPSNQLSGALAAFYKDFLEDDDRIDPLVPANYPGVPREDRSFADNMIDRFGSSIPWDQEDLGPHERQKYHPHGGCAVCNRMTVFYGKEWRHGNLCEATHERIGGLVGEAGIEVFRQLFFIVDRERLTDRHGSNAYLTQDNILANFRFPVLFCHGRDNKVFDPRSAVRSWHRLNRIRKWGDTAVVKSPAKLFIAPGYGHMDFLFGQRAHEDIYPTLADFFSAPAAHDDMWKLGEGSNDPPVEPDSRPDEAELVDRNFHAPRSLLTGPLIQLERRAGRGRVVLWFEQRQMAASKTLGLTFERITPREGASDQVDWDYRRLWHVESGLPRPAGTLGGTLDGAGIFWNAWLDEATIPDFANLPAQRLVLRYVEPAGVTPKSKRSARSSGGLNWDDHTTWGNKLNVMSLELAGTPAGTRDAQRYDEQNHPIIDLAGYPWWQLWIGDGRHPSRRRAVSWLASSCRWPGLPFERNAADEIAVQMQTHVRHREPAEALVLLGDQVYTDATADVADTQEPEERAAQRYRDAWGAPETAKLMASLPTYLVVDDHEYKDGWSAADGSTSDEFRTGFEAAFAYQWRWLDTDPNHAPRIRGGRVQRGFWKEFLIGNVPAFAADTRSERRGRPLDPEAVPEMMGDEQRAALKKWLIDNRTSPKVLCSGSVFGMPEERWLREPTAAAGADGWYAYRSDFTWLAEVIVQHGIRNLIFLSGDYHLSALAELEIAYGGSAPVRALSVVSSGWNATLPFANLRSRELVTDRRVQMAVGCPEVGLASTACILSAAPRQFSKHTLRPLGAGGWQLRTEVFGETGERLKVAMRNL